MNHDHPLAYEDDEFLDSTEARPMRILAEYLDPLRRFRAHNVQDTVVFFGSARVLSRSLAQRNLPAAEERHRRAKADYKAALKRSHKAVEWSRYYEDARQLARCSRRGACRSMRSGTASSSARAAARASWKRPTAARRRRAENRSA